MPVVTNVFRRGLSYCFRVRIPTSLQARTGRRELWRSLATAAASEARVRGVVLHRLTQALWRDLEQAVDTQETKTLIDRWLHAEIVEDARLRDAPEGERYVGLVLRHEPLWMPDTIVQELTHEELDEARSKPLTSPLYLREEVSALELRQEAQEKVYGQAEKRRAAADETVAIEHVRTLFKRAGIIADEFSAPFETATRMMIRAQADLLTVIRLRTSAGWREHIDDDPAAEIIAKLPQIEVSQAAAPKTTNQPAAPNIGPRQGASGLTLGKAAAVAIPELARLANWNGKRIGDYEKAVRTFIFFRDGEDIDIADITPAIAGAFKTAMTHYPTNVRKMPAYRNLQSFSDQVAEAERLGEANLLAATTINTKYVTPIRTILAWHRENGVKVGDPFDGIRARTPRQIDPKRQRRDFTNMEVKRLFSQPLFTGARSLSGPGLYRSGDARVNDWRFWLPMICLFTGMRLNEACGLELSDIKNRDGIEFIHVRDEAEGQRLKSSAARRFVPIHPSLIKVGFLQHVLILRSQDHSRVFPDLELDKYGYYSDGPSRFFSRLLDRIEDTDPDEPGSLTFHSSRHTVISRFRAAEVRQDVSENIVGHEPGSVHAGYGNAGDIPTLKAAMEKLGYGDLDLTAAIQPYASAP